MTARLVAWVVLSFGLTCLWVGSIELAWRIARRRRPAAPSSFVMFHQPSTSTAEAECLRALEELWSIDAADGDR